MMVAVLIRYEDRDTAMYSSAITVNYQQPILFVDRKDAEDWLCNNGYKPAARNSNEFEMVNNEDWIAVIMEIASSPEEAQFVYRKNYGHCE